MKYEPIFIERTPLIGSETPMFTYALFCRIAERRDRLAARAAFWKRVRNTLQFWKKTIPNPCPQ